MSLLIGQVSRDGFAFHFACPRIVGTVKRFFIFRTYAIRFTTFAIDGTDAAGAYIAGVSQLTS